MAITLMRVFVLRAWESSMGVSHSQTVQSVRNAVRVTIFMPITHAQAVPFSAKHAKTTFAQAAKRSISSML